MILARAIIVEQKLNRQKAVSENKYINNGTVDINKFKTNYDTRNQCFNVSFTLLNINHKTSGASGRVFLILKSGPEPSDGWIVFPNKAILVSGKPSPVSKGYHFKIKRFRKVSFDIPKDYPLSDIKAASIAVYSDSGELMLRKNFSINFTV